MHSGLSAVIHERQHNLVMPVFSILTEKGNGFHKVLMPQIRTVRVYHLENGWSLRDVA